MSTDRSPLEIGPREPAFPREWERSRRQLEAEIAEQKNRRSSPQMNLNATQPVTEVESREERAARHLYEWMVATPEEQSKLKQECASGRHAWDSDGFGCVRCSAWKHMGDSSRRATNTIMDLGILGLIVAGGILVILKVVNILS